MPVAKPASIVNNSVRRRVAAINAASARNPAAVPITHGDKPHAATEKRSPFSAAAMPPTVQTHGANPHCRKNTHAAQPSRNSDSGAKTLAIITGPSTVATKFEGVGAEATLSAPTQFRSFQTPKNPPGKRPQEALFTPSGPSLEKIMYSGRKLLAKSSASTATSAASNARKAARPLGTGGAAEGAIGFAMRIETVTVSAEARR